MWNYKMMLYNFVENKKNIAAGTDSRDTLTTTKQNPLTNLNLTIYKFSTQSTHKLTQRLLLIVCPIKTNPRFIFGGRRIPPNASRLFPPPTGRQTLFFLPTVIIFYYWSGAFNTEVVHLIKVFGLIWFFLL